MGSERMFPIQSNQRCTEPYPTSIPWAVADKAYSTYRGRYGSCQTLERLAERGGFCPLEMDDLYPGWRNECSALSAKDAEIERLKAENQRYERLFTSREQDHKELCERYDQLEAENAILKAQLSTAQMSAIEHQAKYVTMHERHQGLWRENLNLKAQLAASEEKRKVLGEEAKAARSWKRWRSMPGGPDQSEFREWWDGAIKATDDAKALEAP